MITKANPSLSGRVGVNNRIPELDALRAVVIVYIVGFWHLFEYSPALMFHKVPLGFYSTFLALGVFVFISGFLLAGRYDLKDKKAVGEFFTKRFIRIYPMYLLVLALFFVFGMVGWLTFLSSVPLLNMIVNRSLPTLWFISLIFVCYALLPVFSYRYRLIRVIGITVILVAAFLFINSRFGWIDTRLAQYLPAFGAGIIVGKSNKIYTFLTKRTAAAVSIILTVGLFFVFRQLESEIGRIVLSQIAILISLPFLLALARSIDQMGSTAIIRWLANISFALYLVHRLVYKAAFMVYQPETFTASLIYYVGLAFPAALVLAWLYQSAYDAVLARPQLFKAVKKAV